MPFKSQAELDEALRVGTVADASVEAVAGESTTASAEGGTAAKDAEAGGAGAAPDVSATDGTDGEAGEAAGDEPAEPDEPIAHPAKALHKSRS